MDGIAFYEMKICKCCLRSDGNILSMAENYDILLETITGIQKTVNSGRWLCRWCVFLLRKINNFRKMCLESHYILMKKNFADATHNVEREAEFDARHEDFVIFQDTKEPSVSNTLCVDFKATEGGSREEIQVVSFIRDGKPSKNFMEDMLVVTEQVKEELFYTEERNDDICDSNNLDYTPAAGKSDSDDSFKMSIQDVINKPHKSRKACSEQSGVTKNKVKSRRKEEFDLVDLKSEEISDGIIHDNEIQCDLCHLTFTKPSRLIRHLNKCKDKLSLRKSTKLKLSQNIKSKGKLKTSLKTICKADDKILKKDIKCMDCGREFNLPCLLKRHAVIHSSSRPFSCSECNKTFRREGDVKKHMTIHSGLKPFICDVCGDKFTALGNLKCHTLRKHSEERLFSCAECGKPFKTDAELRRHSRVHTGERPYPCDICGQTFALAGNLKTHRRIHTGERPYLCNICGSSFTDAGYLKKHRRVHTGEKPYPCELCTLSFSTACGRKTHSAIHSLVKPFSCGDCSYSTSRSQHLKRHQKTHKAKLPH